IHQWRGCYAARLDGEADRRAAAARSVRRLPAILGRHGLHDRERDLAHVSRRAAHLDRWRCRRSDARHHLQGHGHPAGTTEEPLMRELPTFKTLRLEREGWTLRVWLNRPETKNALNRGMVRDLTAVTDLLASDGDIRAVVVRGVNGTFCAGGDIN